MQVTHKYNYNRYQLSLDVLMTQYTDRSRLPRTGSFVSQQKECTLSQKKLFTAIMSAKMSN